MHNTTCELGLPPPPCSKSLFRVDYEGPLYTYIYIHTHTHSKHYSTVTEWGQYSKNTTYEFDRHLESPEATRTLSGLTRRCASPAEQLGPAGHWGQMSCVVECGSGQ